jgi:hypothetical protein
VKVSFNMSKLTPVAAVCAAIASFTFTLAQADPALKSRTNVTQVAAGGPAVHAGQTNSREAAVRRHAIADAHRNGTDTTTIVLPAPVVYGYYCPPLGAYYPQVVYCPSNWAVVYPY